jgi:hypothetical protein
MSTVDFGWTHEDMRECWSRLHISIQFFYSAGQTSNLARPHND